MTTNKVLIVDDEPDYRQELDLVFADEGYETCCARNGREAIDLGARFRPDVLVADWMLKNHIHGLHVAQTLRLVKPGLRTILITGYCSSDLRSDARKAGVFQVIEKPFSIAQLRTAVSAAIRTEQISSGNTVTLEPGVLELDTKGHILYASSAARAFFGVPTDAPLIPPPVSFDSLFNNAPAPDLENAVNDWLTVHPAVSPPRGCAIRTQAEPLDGSRLVVVRDPTDHRPHKMALIEMLLAYQEDRNVSWPFEGRVLLVDDEDVIRRLAVMLLENAGAACYAADSHEQALRLLAGDEGIRYAILDYTMPEGTADILARQLRRLRPDLLLIGNSGTNRRRPFADCGIEHFLLKPWRCEDLIRLIRLAERERASRTDR